MIRFARLAASVTALACLFIYSPQVEGSITYLDPTGDTFNGGVIDAISISIDTSATGQFTLGMQFSGPISLPSTFGPNSVAGFIDLDTDMNAATGGFAPWALRSRAAIPGSTTA